jgi:hypothetical protein
MGRRLRSVTAMAESSHIAPHQTASLELQGPGNVSVARLRRIHLRSELDA